MERKKFCWGWASPGWHLVYDSYVTTIFLVPIFWCMLWLATDVVQEPMFSIYGVHSLSAAHMITVFQLHFPFVKMIYNQSRVSHCQLERWLAASVTCRCRYSLPRKSTWCPLWILWWSVKCNESMSLTSMSEAVNILVSSLCRILLKVSSIISSNALLIVKYLSKLPAI